MTRRLSTLVGAASAIALAAGLTACTGETSAAGDDSVITIATQRQPHLYAPYVYDDLAPDGTTIEVVPMDTSTDQKAALLSGDVDFALMGVPTVISGVAADEDITLVASGADGGSGLVGDADIDGVAGLKGKKVGFVPGSSQEMALRLLVTAAGLDPNSDLEMVSLGYADMANALSSGQIDAFAGAEVGVSLALLDGAEPVADLYATEIGKVNIGLATTATTAADDPELVETVLDIHAKAVEQLADDPEAWADGVQEKFTFDDDVLAQALTNIWLRSDIDDAYRANIDELAKQMVALKVIDEAPTADDVVTEVG